MSNTLMRHDTNYRRALIYVASSQNSYKFKLLKDGISLIERGSHSFSFSSERRWKSVDNLMHLPGHKYFFLPCNGSSYGTFPFPLLLFIQGEAKATFSKRNFPTIVAIISMAFAKLELLKTMLFCVFQQTHNGFGGLFENELQFPPDVWWKHRM